jgi:hypothetical protein
MSTLWSQQYVTRIMVFYHNAMMGYRLVQRLWGGGGRKPALAKLFLAVSVSKII